jgi:hypothetical protein
VPVDGADERSLPRLLARPHRAARLRRSRRRLKHAVANDRRGSGPNVLGYLKQVIWQHLTRTVAFCALFQPFKWWVQGDSNPRPAHDTLQRVINAEEAEIKRQNGQVSPGKARQQNTRLRNDLAIGLKGIGIGLLGKDEREAEKWVERMFDALKQDHPDPSDPLRVMYPDSIEHPGDFKRMFAVTVCRTPPPDHLANVRRWRRAFARLRLAEELYEQELGRLRKEG